MSLVTRAKQTSKRRALIRGVGEQPHPGEPERPVATRRKGPRRLSKPDGSWANESSHLTVIVGIDRDILLKTNVYFSLLESTIDWFHLINMQHRPSVPMFFARGKDPSYRRVGLQVSVIFLDSVQYTAVPCSHCNLMHLPYQISRLLLSFTFNSCSIVKR